MRNESVFYTCEKCKRKLNFNHNSLNIVTSLNENSYGWSRLHVLILHKHGIHNEHKTEDADLCKSCAILLLEDALSRVKSGERTTAGVEKVEQSDWE
jgi:hypothetical protein